MKHTKQNKTSIKKMDLNQQAISQDSLKKLTGGYEAWPCKW
ncbi:MAG: hypothetical protein AAFQ98_14945 [Bacteroidota bacterium]